MAIRAYSYKLRMEVALLDEHEFESLGKIGSIEAVKEYRKRFGASLNEALTLNNEGKLFSDGQQRYLALTGIRLEHPDMLFAVRMAHYGALCPECGKPFRTPRAKMCAECGYALPEGQQAGPLTPKA